MRNLFAVLAALLFAACGGGPPGWAGRWTSTGTWDLSGPLGNGRTLGDSVTDLLVEQTVSLLGVPSLVEDKAQLALDGAIRTHVKAVVDPFAPAELTPGGVVYDPLAMTLAQVKVHSELTLSAGKLPKSVEGTETFTGFEYTYQGTPTELDATVLGKQGAPIVAEWSGKETSATELDIEPHDVSVQFSELVRRVTDRIIDAAGQTALKNQVVNAIACDQIVARVAASGNLTVTVAEQSYTLTSTQLRSACDTAVPIVSERVLGLIKVDSQVVVGGKVSYSATRLQSGAGHGGLVTVAPAAIAPRLGVSFTAARPAPK